jgi:TolA-binding protein
LAGILNNSNNSLAELLAPQLEQLQTEREQGFQQMQAQLQQLQAQQEQFQAQEQKMLVVLHLQTQQQNLLDQQNDIGNGVNRLFTCRRTYLCECAMPTTLISCHSERNVLEALILVEICHRKACTPATSKSSRL